MFYDQLFTRSNCNYCQQEIPGMGIECCECTITPHVRLCAECFSLGAEMGPHKADHRYRFFDSGSLLIYPSIKNEESSCSGSSGTAPDEETPGCSSWSARADIRLLDAIEQYGFGNWQDISKHVECKSPSEAKDEYVKRFVTGTTGQATWKTFPYNSEVESTEKIQIPATIVQRPIDHTLSSDNSPLSPSLASKLPPLDISSDEMQQLGYMTDRDDYEKEFDNDAEKLVSQLTFNSEDDDAEISLKLSLVDMYSRRLRERVRRKRVIRDYQLVSLFFKKDRTNFSKDSASNGAMTRKRFAAYEKELTERLRHLSHFHTAREHENFIRNFIKEKEIKFRIQELYKYRKNGITREEDCTEYEKHKLSLMRRSKMLSNQSEANSPGKVGNGSSSRSIPPVIPDEDIVTSLNQLSHKSVRRSANRRASAAVNNGRSDDGDGDGDGSDRVDDGSLNDQRSTTRKRRRKRRVMLSRQKSHTPAVLYRRLQLKLRGITIRSAFITSNREAAENPGADAPVVDSTTNSRKRTRLPKLIPASRKTKGYGRPIYC